MLHLVPEKIKEIRETKILNIKFSLSLETKKTKLPPIAGRKTVITTWLTELTFPTFSNIFLPSKQNQKQKHDSTKQKKKMKKKTRKSKKNKGQSL